MIMMTTMTRWFSSEAGTNSTGLSSGASSPQVVLNIHPLNGRTDDGEQCSLNIDGGDDLPEEICPVKTQDRRHM